MARGGKIPTTKADRERLEQIAQELADLLGIDPEFVMVEPVNKRISVSSKQAARIVQMLKEKNG
jgi:hypothetical protein